MKLSPYQFRVSELLLAHYVALERVINHPTELGRILAQIEMTDLMQELAKYEDYDTRLFICREVNRNFELAAVGDKIG